MISDVDQDLRLALRTDADYAQTTWNGYSTKFAQPRSATPVRRMYYPTPASEPASYVELATVSLDYAAPVLFVDQPRHGREESLPGALVEGSVAREGTKQPQVTLRVVGHPKR